MTKFLTAAELNRAAPSIFADRPAAHVSDKYAFVPTTQVLSTLESSGWLPVRVQETSVRLTEKQGYQKHMIRLRHRDAQVIRVGDSLPEIVLTNSHDGLASFALSLGLFRLVCSNGLVVSDGMFESARIKHIGYQDDAVIDIVGRVIESAPMIADSVAAWNQTELTQLDQLAFAKGALALRWQDKAPIEAVSLLKARRWEDGKKSVWSTFNTIQENMMQGGLRGRSESGRRSRTRPVQSVSEDIRLNKALWTMAQALANHKTK